MKETRFFYCVEPDYLLCRLEIEKFQEDGLHEPYESRGSRTGLEVKSLWSTLQIGNSTIFVF